MTWSDAARRASAEARRRKAKGRQVAGTQPHAQPRGNWTKSGLKVPSREAGAYNRGQRKEAALHQQLRTTDRTRGKVAGSTRLRKAQSQLKAGIAQARSMKGTKTNRYAPQNKGGIRRG